MSTRLPVIFIGHGNPMNGILDNPFSQSLAALAKGLPRPRAVLCISAHWMSEGTWVTSMAKPRTIHDFYGFPQPLFDVQYPAPGSPEVASLIRSTVLDPEVHADPEIWGLDHGTWTVLKHMYPNADIPVLQMSLNMRKPAEYHFQIGEQLRALREQGVLIVGSGNIVHNLSQISWDTHAKPFDWAVEFDDWMKANLQDGDFKSIIKDSLKSSAGKMSVPTMDHWYPLFYTLGAAEKTDALRFIYEGIENSSISMRTFTLG